jgi:LacI family transcriptional regulator
MKRVTLEDLAAELGLSKYSVSRALSGKPGVSSSTRRRVVEVARARGYRHATLGRPGASGNRRTIVLLIPDQDIDDVEFWMGLISGASREAERLGYVFVTRPIGDATSHAPSDLDAVAGVIVAGSRARQAWEPYRDAGIATVLVTYPTPLEPYDTVHAADWEGGAVAARHLAELGHRRLAYVTEAPEKPSFAARHRGFRATAQNIGVEDVEALHIDAREPSLSFERAYRERAGRGQGPTGILASTDGIAFAVASALHRLGLDVPRDVSVVGFNDATASARFVPKLTTLHIPTRELGTVAMSYLHDRIESGDLPPRRFRIVPTFVRRDSTGPPASPSVSLAAAVPGP